MYPLFPLRTLSADIEHSVCEVANDEGGLGDAGRLYTRAEDVLIVGDVVRLCNAVNGIKVAARQDQQLTTGRRTTGVLFSRVVELVLARALEASLQAGVLPEGGDGGADLGGQAVALNLLRLHKDSLDMIFAAAVGEG